MTQTPADGLDNAAPFLLLSLSERRSHLWGFFEFGFLKGYLRSTRLSSTDLASGRTLSTLWRSYEDGKYRQRLGSDNILKLTFLERGKLKGEISCAGLTNVNATVHFVGFEDSSERTSLHQPPSPWQWKQDWKEIAQVVRQDAGIRKRPREVTSDTDSDYYSEDSDEVAEREKGMKERIAAADVVAAKIF